MSESLPSSARSPLRQRNFRSLWTATLASNVGTGMHDVSADGLTTSMRPDPLGEGGPIASPGIAEDTRPEASRGPRRAPSSEAG